MRFINVYALANLKFFCPYMHHYVSVQQKLLDGHTGLASYINLFEVLSNRHFLVRVLTDNTRIILVDNV